MWWGRHYLGIEVVFSVGCKMVNGRVEPKTINRSPVFRLRRKSNRDPVFRRHTRECINPVNEKLRKIPTSSNFGLPAGTYAAGTRLRQATYIWWSTGHLLHPWVSSLPVALIQIKPLNPREKYKYQNIDGRNNVFFKKPNA